MLTLTLTLTLLNPDVCAHIVDTQKIFSGIYKKIFFARGACAGFAGEANNCTTCKNLTLAYLAVVSIYHRQ